MKKTRRFWVNILAILILFIGTIGTMKVSGKIIATSVELFVLNDNAAYYNEQRRKTDAMTEDYNKNHEERQAIYNSEDTVVRVFSNQNILVKVAILILAIVAFIMIPYMWGSLIRNRISQMRKAEKRRKIRKQASMYRMRPRRNM